MNTNQTTLSTATDNNQKQLAKERAKKILACQDIDAVLDTAPDPNLLQKVEAEIQGNDGEKDLLSHHSPQE